MLLPGLAVHHTAAPGGGGGRAVGASGARRGECGRSGEFARAAEPQAPPAAKGTETRRARPLDAAAAYLRPAPRGEAPHAGRALPPTVGNCFPGLGGARAARPAL